MRKVASRVFTPTLSQGLVRRRGKARAVFSEVRNTGAGRQLQASVRTCQGRLPCSTAKRRHLWACLFRVCWHDVHHPSTSVHSAQLLTLSRIPETEQGDLELTSREFGAGPRHGRTRALGPLGLAGVETNLPLSFSLRFSFHPLFSSLERLPLAHGSVWQLVHGIVAFVVPRLQLEKQIDKELFFGANRTQAVCVNVSMRRPAPACEVIGISDMSDTV